MLADLSKRLALSVLTGALVLGSVDFASANSRRHYGYHRQYYGGYRHYRHYGYRPYRYGYPGCIPALGILSGDFCGY